MSKFKDLRCKTFGRLTVLNESPIKINGFTYWKCKCICGNEKNIYSGNLLSGKSTSCGCSRKGKKRKSALPPRLKRIFYNMKTRCYNSKSTRYKDYGDRGIAIYADWLNDSKKFYDWAINNGYNDSLTIDRIDTNGDYTPYNCRWVTMQTQQNNRRNNHIITINGKRKTVSQWAKIYNVTRDGFLYKYKHNLL